MSDAESSVEEKHFEVVRDPLDGNIYLQLEPHELHKYSQDEIKRIEQQFEKHVKAEMPEGEFENLQKAKQMETEISKQIMEEKRQKDHETDSDQTNNDGNK